MKVLVQSVTCALNPLILWRLVKRRTARTASRNALREDDSQRLNSVDPKPLSSSIYELFSPVSADSIALDIFFFHGLQQESSPDAHVSTWRSKPGEDSSEVIWPQAWLPAKYPQARIMTVSYDARIETTVTEGRMDLHLIGEALLEEISQVRQANSHPIILVGHSFGGLVIKQLCTHAFQVRDARRDVSFLNCIEGILFYGTPHRGMEIPRGWNSVYRSDWNSLMCHWTSTIHGIRANEPLLKFVQKLSTEAARLHEKFEETWRYYGWQINAVNETHAASEGEVLVPEASSRCSGYNVFVGSDHYSICRPSSQQCIKYLQLTQLLDSVYDKIKNSENVFEHLTSTLVLDGNSKEELLERAKGHLQEHPLFGFAGMAGSGKTSMARLVAKYLGRGCHSEFGLLEGQFNRAELKEEVKAKLAGHRKKLFLILDDIPCSSHTYAVELQEIAVENDQRVKFIATSRDKGLLRQLGWIPRVAETWNVPLLEFDAAKTLFYSLAFPVKGEPPSHLNELVDEVVRRCAGLPLCLEVAGRYLEGQKDRWIWEETARALRNVADVRPLGGVWEKLKASFNSLTNEEKEMFLDTAYFLVSEDSPFSFDEFKATWTSMYGYAADKWQTLLDRFLVHKDGVKKKVEPEVVGGEATELASVSIPAGRQSEGWQTSKTKYQVHDHLKAIGTKIARERCTDVTVPPVGDPATWETSHLGKIVALSAKVQSDDPSFEAPVEEVNDNPCCGWKNQTSFATLESVRYLTLKVPRVCLNCNAKGGMRLPRDLRMLQWSGSTSDIIKLDQQPSFWKSLVVLKLKRDDDCGLDILSPEMCRNFLNLQRLSLESKDTSLPGLAELRQLRYLEIQCEDLGSLPDLGSLSKLEFLCLRECYQFITWPNGMDFRSLTNLQTLMLESCWKLQTLPSQFHPSLKRLTVTDCHSIRFLPDGIGELSNLETVDLDSCIRLENLPESFGSLSSLISLNLAHCKNLTSLPDKFGELSSLRVLWLDYCTELHTLGSSFGQLPSLKLLNLDYCDKLSAVAGSIPSLPGLKISRL